jgi:DNA-directed RNA polymerases I, II, and III subunit RPABC1
MTEFMDIVTPQQLSANGSRLFRARRTTLLMLKNRGYNVHDEMDMEGFVEEYGPEPDRNRLEMVVTKTEDPSDQIMVYFPEDERVRVVAIKVLTDKMNQLACRRAMMVVRRDVTPFAKQAIAVCQVQQNVVIEVWAESDLLAVITQQ